jgi:hypothetical protein
MDKKFAIKEVSGIKFVDSMTGKEMVDLRDREPIRKNFNPNTPILELVKSVSPSYELCNNPLIRKYGFDTFGSICEVWYWNDELAKATNEELWKIYGMIQADWLSQYEYWYHKEVYEFRQFKREQTIKD